MIVLPPRAKLPVSQSFFSASCNSFDVHSGMAKEGCVFADQNGFLQMLGDKVIGDPDLLACAFAALLSIFLIP